MLRILLIASLSVAIALRLVGGVPHAFANGDTCGDLNGDESINVLDVVTSLKFDTGEIQPLPIQRELGDLNKNARVDIGDANRTLSHVVDVTTPLDACGPEPLQALQIEEAFSELAFDELTNLVQPDDGENQIFVTEQRTGLIWVFPNDQQVTTDDASVFLNIRDRMKSSLASEEGLLGLTFHPDYKNNGYFYVLYSAGPSRHTILSRFSVKQGNPAEADPDSELILMDIPNTLTQFANHNGGQLAFGPDGYLYIALGDGGGSGDPGNNGQNPETPHGSILRINVNGTSDEMNYLVPPDNPFVGVPNALDEIWAYGLRNPWRFSFEPETGLLWAADVGQGMWEEVDIITKGKNYGWNTMEGPDCFQPSENCDQTGLELPIHQYDHDDGCSITGGYVYQGQRISSLMGAYVYGDYCNGNVWGIRYDGNAIVEPGAVLLGEIPQDFALVSFSIDLEGNLYILSRNDGIYRFVPPTP